MMKHITIAIPFSQVVHGYETFEVVAKDVDHALEKIRNGDEYVQEREIEDYGCFQGYYDDFEIIEMEEHEEEQTQ